MTSPAAECPYCGGEALVVTPMTWGGSFGGLVHMAYCPACKASGPWKRSAEEADESWANVTRREDKADA